MIMGNHLGNRAPRGQVRGGKFGMEPLPATSMKWSSTLARMPIRMVEIPEERRFTDQQDHSMKQHADETAG
ncbi:hypothetical protein niasHS_016136 [Heterodera schachtii]|uniref:Uncharacterized protein n=1 Tax=Heterodera schachtii TaxID=97005 RepID=A0ABD2HQR5_HETSC